MNPQFICLSTAFDSDPCDLRLWGFLQGPFLKTKVVIVARLETKISMNIKTTSISKADRLMP